MPGGFCTGGHNAQEMEELSKAEPGLGCGKPAPEFNVNQTGKKEKREDVSNSGVWKELKSTLM